MTSLVHISDLHFGREDPVLARALLTTIAGLQPDAIVISGDFTQRAKKRQFRAARAWLSALPKIPRLIVPGNHDISATNLYSRALNPLRRYKRYLTADLAPYLELEGLAIAGVNTVRKLKSKDGRINSTQIATACAQLESAPQDFLRILVTHHPIDLPASDRKHPVLARAGLAMKSFARAHVDLFLSGHLHGGLSLTTTARYPMASYAAVVAHAGTAISTRTRAEPNTWNLIHLNHDRIAIDTYAWREKAFQPIQTTPYNRTAAGWAATAPVVL